jgi:hypothetical protein
VKENRRWIEDDRCERDKLRARGESKKASHQVVEELYREE